MTRLHPVEEISFEKLDQSYVVEASAGTGKTWTIERLFIKALLEKQDIALQNILVVTFTTAATRELKLRISEQILSTIELMLKLRDVNIQSYITNDVFINSFLLKRKDNFEKDIIILSRSLQNFDHASIYTIHGFCNKVIHDYQIECGVNQPFKLVSDKSYIFETGVRNFLREKIINNPSFRNSIDKVLQNLNSLFITNYRLDLIQSILIKIPKDLIWINNGTFKLRYEVKYKPDLTGLINDINTKEDVLIVKTHVLSAISLYLADYFNKSQSTSTAISYDELIQILADKVSCNSSLRNRLNHDYPIAFIDEFQDTDFLQWQIFSNIYGIHQNKPKGSMVVVGDPKQAIYRFRGADIDVYLEARKLIKSSLNLVENRRSHPDIMNFINRLFDMNINHECFGPGIDYHDVIPKVNLDSLVEIPNKLAIKDSCLNLGVVNDFYDEKVQIIAITGSNAPEKEENLLNNLTLEILALLNSDPKLISKMAILVNKNREAGILVKHLNKFGIKACELKIGNIFATSTARDLLLILEAIVDLSDRRLLIKAIATKIFNFPLNQLILADSDKNNLDNIIQIFFSYKQLLDQNGIFSLIYKLIDDLRLIQTNSGITRREISNLLQLAELINKHTDGINDAMEVLYWLRAKINNVLNSSDADLNDDNEEMVRLDNDEEQLIITTQHKAKGLEYDILFCPYFKRDAVKNSRLDPQYTMPFFAKYRDESGLMVAKLINDEDVAEKIIKRDNQEIHRLNYVAITRAKSRVYIYLKAPTLTRTHPQKYNSLYFPDKIVELFGYERNDIRSNKHGLFYYHELFNNPHIAIKNPALLPGVVVYKRDNILKAHLNKLKLVEKQNDKLSNSISTLTLDSEFKLNPGYTRQSYSGIIKLEQDIFSDRMIDYVPDQELIIEPINYKYNVLNDLSGANFGVLFHNLCEMYPISYDEIGNYLLVNNIDIKYKDDLFKVIDEVFNYPITIDGLKLATLENALPELAFNLNINRSLDIMNEFSQLLDTYYGADHPYVAASKRLTQINPGFLNGFIDLFFEHNGKYYILDYKTNILNSYNSTFDVFDKDNPLIQANAHHHYYLQYLLYLVAIKRHLEQCLNISDASSLIGGAVYYYIRGVFVENASPGGIYIDKNCQEIVAKLDGLLR